MTAIPVERYPLTGAFLARLESTGSPTRASLDAANVACQWLGPDWLDRLTAFELSLGGFWYSPSPITWFRPDWDGPDDTRECNEADALEARYLQEDFDSR